jgi:Zn-dependent oligopeptidase
MAKAKAKHPPSYYKYRKEHPTVSIVLSQGTKDALDKARGEMTYAKFLISLFTPDGAFSQFQKQHAQLASERVSLENEKQKLNAQLASEKDSLKNVIKNFERVKQILAEIERFYVPCRICGKPVLVQSTDPDWNSTIKPQLREKFNWVYHMDCGM